MWLAPGTGRTVRSASDRSDRYMFTMFCVEVRAVRMASLTCIGSPCEEKPDHAGKKRTPGRLWRAVAGGRSPRGFFPVRPGGGSEFGAATVGDPVPGHSPTHAAPACR